MAKSGRYTETRRMLMQAVMALVLGATLGLAAYVERRKVASAHVELGEQRELLDLVVRLPEGWGDGSGDAKRQGLVLAVEPSNHRGRRFIMISRLNKEDASARDYLKALYPHAEIQPFKFEFAQEAGEVAKVPEDDLKTNRRPEGVFRRTTLVAATKAPSGGLVVVQVQTPPSLGRSAEILLKDVVGAIELNDAANGDTRSVVKERVKPSNEP